MSDLKPIGSEKLTGQDKLRRIMEIARYKENLPNTVNETSKKEFDIQLSDGAQYQIVKEKLGYIIKKTISESETDYLEPMKNRKYYSSYSQALKRLNLITKEVNRLTENEEGTSLFGEQKKFVLKTPKPAEPSADEMPAPPPPAEPPAVPGPELPPSPEMEAPMPEAGAAPEGEIPPAPEGEEIPDETPIAPEGGEAKGGEVSFRMIQKLTGKLTQKIREFETEKGLTSENIKYVVNMVLSAVDLTALSDEDREDIMAKIEGTEEEMGMEDMGSEEEMGMEDMGSDEMGMEAPIEPEVEPMESGSKYGAIIDSIFGESKVDRVISKYFSITEKEKRQKSKQKFINESEKKKIVESKMKKVVGLCETIEQELMSKKFLRQNPNFVFVGKTNKNNLVFESSNKQVKISPEGNIL